MRFVLLFAVCLFAAEAEDMGVARKLSENKFGPLPGMPSCISMAVESGDPPRARR